MGSFMMHLWRCVGEDKPSFTLHWVAIPLNCIQSVDIIGGGSKDANMLDTSYSNSGVPSVTNIGVSCRFSCACCINILSVVLLKSPHYVIAIYIAFITRLIVMLSIYSFIIFDMVQPKELRDAYLVVGKIAKYLLPLGSRARATAAPTARRSHYREWQQDIIRL